MLLHNDYKAKAAGAAHVTSRVSQATTRQGGSTAQHQLPTNHRFQSERLLGVTLALR